MHQTGLRALVARVQEHVSRVASPAGSAGHSDDHTELVIAWDALVQSLALGTAPETRQCPKCNSTGMAKATICGNCWTRFDETGAHG